MIPEPVQLCSVATNYRKLGQVLTKVWLNTIRKGVYTTCAVVQKPRGACVPFWLVTLLKQSFCRIANIGSVNLNFLHLLIANKSCKV